MAEEQSARELVGEAQKFLLKKIIESPNAAAAEKYARAFRYVLGGPQPGSIEVKS